MRADGGKRVYEFLCGGAVVCHRGYRESLSLQHVDKDHKAVGFKYLSFSFFLSPQSLGAAIDSRGDFLGQGQGD